MKQLRLARRVAAMLGTLLVYLTLHGAWRLARRPSPWPPRFLGAIGRVVGARVNVTGTPLDRDVIFVSNHVSWIDILVLGGATGTAFVAKAELADSPLVGWLCELNRTVFVRREDRRAMPDQIEAIRVAAARHPLTIFAEGTTGDGETMLPFKPSLLQVVDAPDSRLRVQPIWIDYRCATREVAWGDEHGTVNALRLLRRRGTLPVVLHCLDPIDPAAFAGRKAVTAEARRRIEVAMAAEAMMPDGPLDADALAARRPVWIALSNLFLDTDVALLRADDARLLAASPYSLDQIERILADEVTPVCGDNLRQVAGEWAMFPDEWLEKQIARVRRRGRPGKPMKAMWPDWLALRAAAEQLRASPPPQLADSAASA